MLKREKYLLVSILLLLSVISFYRILFYPIITWGDWMFHFSETTKEWLSHPSIWSEGIGLGSINIGSSGWPYYFLYGIIGNIGYGSSFADKIIFVLPSLLFAVTIYLLIFDVFRSKVPSFIGAVVYTFSTYFLILRTGHLTLVVAYGLAPLIILLFRHTLERKKLTLSITTGVMGFFVSFYEFRAFYIITAVLFLYFIYFIFCIKKINKFRKILVITFYAAIPIVITLLLNIYWIWGFINIGSLNTNAIFERSLFGNELINLDYVVTLHHPFWTGSAIRIFETQHISLQFWLIPIFAFAGLYLCRKRTGIVFFGIVALLGIFLTKQVAIPFNSVYPWLYENFPGFNAFRESSKFFFLVTLGYSVLIAAFVDWLWKNWNKKKWQVYGKYLVTILITGIFLWNAKPFITGEIGTLFVPRSIPKDYVTLKDNILRQPEYFRTLWVPKYSRWTIYTRNHPKLSTINTINSIWSHYVKSVRTSNITGAELMAALFHNEKANNLLDSSSIKYVIVPLADDENDDNFFVYYGEEREFYINALDKLEYLEKIDIGTEEIAVYENEDFRPHIYTTAEEESIKEVVPYEEVEYTSVNPTEYTVTLDNISKPIYINFSESHHPGWKVRAEEFNWWESIIEKNYFLPDDIHSKNDAGLNSFYIDPKIVCKVDKVDKVGNVQNEGCTRNEDGSYDIQLTLFFKPQAYMYAGGIVSLTTLAGILGYLGYVGARSISNRQRTKSNRKEKNS